MTTLEVLKAARELIGTPERWCRGQLAKDCEANPVPPYSDGARCWCASGALTRVAGKDGTAAFAWDALNDEARLVGWEGIVAMNDRGHYRDVLAAFDRAIVKVEAWK